MKKVLATLLVLAMIVTGLVCLNPKASEVKAASNATDHGTFVTVEKEDWKYLDGDEVPDLEGYLFAGYFKSENCTLADKSSKGNAKYAKFVKDDMLDVKVQTTNGVVQKSDVEDKDGNKVYEGKYVIRFISSVESLNYSKIGFELEYTTASGETKKVRNTSSKVFTKIESTTGVSGGTIDKYEFSPKVVGEDSEYFMTAKLPVEVGNEAVTYKVRAFWTTLDGTTVMGKTRCVSVNDGNNEIVNMTVDAKSQLDVQAEYTATYGPNADPTAEGAGTSGAKVEVLSSDADGHTNIRITLQGDDTATSLKSATKFVIFDKDGNEVATGVYRNYYTKYTGSGTADTSWYDVEPTATRFAIATSADLYGLASVVSAGTDQFAGDEIHVVRGITLNKGKAMTSEETGGAPTWVADAGETTYSWNAIGTSSYPFKGVFDGDGNEISGLYRNFGTNWYVGFFGCTAVGSEFKNFKLTNSYIRADGNGVGIVGKGMVNKFENVYTDWIIHCERSGDSGLGGLWGNPTDISNLTTEINNCWFDGEIYRVNGNLVGGFVGCLSGSKSVMNFNDCLFTGTVKNMAGARYGAIIAGATWNDSIINVKNSFVLGDVKTTSATVSGAVAGYLSSTTKLNLENVFVSDASSLDYYGSMTASNFSQTNVQKVARNTICGLDQDEINALFNDSTDAWVPDNTVNDIDRGTPILQEFAEWWQNKQYESKVVTSWYNETDTEFVLTSASQLYGLAKIVNDGTDTFSGKTIKLGADIALNKADSKIVQKWVYGSAIAENEWVPIGTSTNKFAGVFDGQGHTISGLYLDTNVEGAGLFGYSAKPSEFKNFKLVDSYMKTSASRLGIVGRAGVVSMENIYTNAIMISTATANDGLSDVGGLIGTIDLIGSSASDYTNIYTTITNCWFDGYIQISNAGRKAGGFIGGMGGNASVGFYNCLSTGTVTGGYNLGGFFGAKDTYATCDIKNCLSVATVTANPINSANASKYGSFFGDHSASNYNSKMSTSYGTIKIIGAGNNPATGIVKTRDDIMMTDVATLFPESTAWVGDKKLGYNNTDRGTPILATFAEWWIENVNHDELTVDFSWYNDTDTEFTLYDAADLNGFAYIANNTDDFTGKTVKLGANIQLNEVNDDILTSLKQRTVILENKWTPIGTSEKPFNGTFDGENYEISGLYLNATTNGAGMFGTTAASATFKNFKLVDSYMRSASENLGIVGKGTLNGFENVYTNAIMDSETHAVAGFVGQVVPKDNSGNGSFHTSFKNCWFDGEIIQRNASSYAMGGFVGVSCTTGVSGESNGAGIEFLNCLSTGTITGGYRLGGFYGWKSNYAKLEFRNCLSVATLTSDPESNNPTYVGAFVGDHTTSRYNAKAYDSYGIGTIVGNYSGTAKEFETTTYNKTRSYLIDTDESTLFPVLSGETENAWVNDIGYNAVNRGTPILGTFDEFWLARQPETELIDRADTSWYNDNDTEFVLTTQGQLYGLSQLGQTNTFAGKTIKLGKDIALNKVDVNSVEAWKNDEQPAGQWKPLVGFAGTFDGQGNTISGLYLNTTTASAGMFGTTTATAVIKDFQLVDSYMKSTAKGLGIVGTGTFASMENVYTSAVMVSTSTDVAGFAGTVATNGGTVLFDNCWFDGEIIHTGDYLVGGFVGEDAGATVITFNNCLNTGKITGTSKVGGFMGWANNYAVKTFNNCLSVGEYVATETGGYCGALLGQLNTSSYNFTTTNVYGVGATFNGAYSGKGVNDGSKYENDTFLKTRDYICSTDVATLFAGSTAWANDNENGWNDTDRGTPILASFKDFWLARQTEPNYTVDLSWYNTTDNEFTLNDVADVKGFVYIANNKDDFADKTVKLGKDIVLNTPDVAAWKNGTKATFEWTPIGTSSKKFAGTFDGQGHTISGLYLDTTVGGSGMFGKVAGTAKLKNFKLVDSYMKSTASGLGLVGEGWVESIENVYSNAYMTSTATVVSGFIASYAGVYDTVANGDAAEWANGTMTIKNCWFDGEIETSNYVASGFVGTQSGRLKVVLEDCLYTGTINSTYSGAARAGALYGWLNYGARYEITNCLAVGTVNAPKGEAYRGEFVGQLSTSASYVVITNSYAKGTKILGYGTASWESCLMDRQAIVDQGTLLFPTSTAWVNDIGYNDTNRGTPMLKTFAEWWLERNPASGLLERPDTSWYDADKTEYTLTTASQLYGLAQVAKTTTLEGKTIKLGANIALNEVDATILDRWQGGTAVGKNWTPIGSASKPFAGTFDGQGKIISGLFLNTTASASGLFGTTGAKAEIKDFKLIDSYMKSTGNQFGLIGEGSFAKIEKVYNAAIMSVQGGNHVGGFIGRAYGSGAEMYISNCWFDGEITQTAIAASTLGTQGGVSGFVGMTAAGDDGTKDGVRPIFVFNDCLNSGSLSGYNRIGGFIGWNAYGNKTKTSTMENCLMVGSVVSDNESATKAMFVGDYDTSGLTNATRSYTTGDVVVQGASATKFTYNTDAVKAREDLYTDVNTLFPDSTAWVKDSGYNDVDRGTPILSDFASWWTERKGDGNLTAAPSTAWYTSPETAGEYVIQNKGDLLGFLSLAKKGETFEGKTIKLGANITLNTPDVENWQKGKNLPTYRWTPITFKGNFDGQNHFIAGVYLKSNATNVGFFGKTVAGSAISNFRLLDSYIEQTYTSSTWSHFTGAIVGDSAGDIVNVYSNATVVSTCHYTAGITGITRPATTSNETVTIENCWFDGKIELTKEVGYTGGIVGYQENGILNLTNVLYTGHIKANRPTADKYGIGGIIGQTYNTVTETNLESVVSAGTFDIPNGTSWIGSVVGYFYSGVDATDTSNYKLSNVFANRGWGKPFNWGGGNGTLTGQVVQTSNGDRLLGYVPQTIAGASTAQQLDFTTNKTWTMRTNDVPVLTVFKDIVDVRTLVSTADLTAENLTNALGLGTINGNFANAVAEGAGDYVVTVSGSSTTYNNYLTQLETLGFTKFVDNAGTSMATDGIYSATYVKGSNSALDVAQWVVNVTYVNNNGTIFVSINSDVDSVANTLLNDDEKNPLGMENGNSAISLSMLEDIAGLTVTGNCFVFQLPNGHFIINDGNTNGGSGQILKAYLQSLVGEGNPIYIDAWVISHFHNDHGGALMDMASDSSLRTNIYVDALYVNEASMYAQTTFTEGGNAYSHTQTILDGARKLQRSASNSESPVVYQVHMGQRYYLNGITLDVVNTPEQLADGDWKGGDGTAQVPDTFNTSSVNIVYTIQEGGKRILIGGDTTQTMMKYIMSAYGKNSSSYGTSKTLSNINVFAAYHHGKNAINTYDPTHIEADGVDKAHIAAKAYNTWADYILKNTNNASGFKFDVMLFPNQKKFETYRVSSDTCHVSGCDGRYHGDDGSTPYPYNLGEINQYYADNATLNFTTGYQDSTSATDANRHGTVKITFNANGQISYTVYNSVHGQDVYTFTEFGSASNGTGTEDTEI